MTNFSVAAVFSNHMVLQQNKKIAVFGKADINSFITVSLYDSKKSLLAANSIQSFNESWLLFLPPVSAQNDCSLEITCEDQKITYSDVAIGEVWLAGGQSNMEFELQNCTEGPEELARTNAGENVRFYYTNKIAWKDDAFYKAEKNTSWQTWDSSAKGSWSAVGYFFAKKLASDLGCTVGIIGCNWGGTSASAWMRREFLEKDEDLKSYLTEQEEAVKGKSIEEQIKEFDEYEIENQKWQEKYSELWKENHSITWEQAEETLGKNPWPGPRSCKNPYRPTGLYDCMLSRIIPYSLKGILWYQGESDDHKPGMYYKLFSSLIENWRCDWKDLTLPFIFVQLPVHRYKADKDFKHWCLIREAQAKTAAMIKNTWLTSAFDLGEFNDIHPKAKKALALRMELNAAANIYKIIPRSLAAAPIFKDALFIHKNKEPGSALLYFENAEEGFEIREDKSRLAEYKEMEENKHTPVPENFTGFELSGADKIFYPAEFELSKTDSQKNIIILHSKEVTAPCYARYGWYNYGPVTIYGKNGLPLCPFFLR